MKTGKIYKIKKYIFFEISAEKYFQAKVHAITIGSRSLFWVIVRDVQE